MASATLGWLAERNCGVHITCASRVYVPGDMLGETFELHMLRGEYGLSLSAVEAVERWGAEATLEQVRAKSRCKVCGERNARIEVSVPAVKMGAGA